MFNQCVTEILVRDLNRLKTEINAYENPAHLWITGKGISNSAGNLCLHLIGNLNHFIGATLGDTGYIRDREGEFANRDISIVALEKLIDDTVAMLPQVLNKIEDTEFSKPFPLLFQGEEKTKGFMLLNLISHLGYHLGQINYHRRLLYK